MTGTRFVTQGVGFQNKAFARKLIANQQQPAPHSLAQTVDLYSAADVFESETLPGLVYVRSNFSAHRYYTVYHEECSCGGTLCRHQKRALAFQHRPDEAMAYTDRLLANFASQERIRKAVRDERHKYYTATQQPVGRAAETPTPNYDNKGFSIVQ
jgi:hypothetical protein